MTTTTQHKIRVNSNGVSTIQGKTKMSVGHDKHGPNALTPDLAEELLCGRRLEITMVHADEQMSLANMQPEPIESLCEVKSYSSKPGKYSMTLVFDEEDMPIDKLKMFQFSDIEITLEVFGEAEPEDDDDDEGAGDLYEEVDD